jgi:hypothetical protein
VGCSNAFFVLTSSALETIINTNPLWLVSVRCQLDVAAKQGDQMSFWKKTPQKKHFWLKLIHNLPRGKRNPTMWTTCVIFEKLPKESHHPMSEFSPNLVTLPPNLFSRSTVAMQENHSKVPEPVWPFISSGLILTFCRLG